MRTVFISYADADKELVERLFIDLRSAGIEVKFDRALALEESWVKTLEVAIRTADFVLVVVSPKYFDSPWAEKEMFYSLSREEGKGVVRTIPVIAAECKLPYALEGRVQFDLSENYREGVNGLVSWIMSGIASGIRKRLVNSGDRRPVPTEAGYQER